MRIAGRIGYYRKAIQTGREWFSVTGMPDGGFALDARCEMDDDRLLRHCAWRLDAELRPLDATMRCEVEGRLDGAAVWRIAGARVEQALLDPDGPPRVATFEAAEPVRFIALHPLIGDGLGAALHDPQGAPRQAIGGCVSSSHRPNGSGPQHADGFPFTIERREAADIEVRAGRFPAQRFALSWRPEWPDADLWVTRDAPPVLLRLRWDFLDAEYELETLMRD